MPNRINSVEKFNLTKNLKISRAVTGLWQIADMEKKWKYPRSNCYRKTYDTLC